MSEKKPYYISTAIAYTSAKPHIGNTYEIVLADAIARFKRQAGFDVYFQTGTDEHGQKIQQKAEAAGISPQEYVDNVAGQIKNIWDLMNTTYDRFVRTTDPEHKDKVQKIFRKMYEKGDIYKGKYEGKYCTPCESFWTESQLVDGKCPDCGRECVDAEEEAYFFKMSKYADRLMKHIEEHPEFIQPESRKNEMINNFLKPGLQDLCVSRSSFTWGVPLDFAPGHVSYVWLDALSNYITFCGYDTDGNHSEHYKKFWPADLHLIGKDIVRFHTIYWPIFLMSMGEPLPKQVFGHPWLLVKGDKMSKSLGNVIYADDLVNLFGVDRVVRRVLPMMRKQGGGKIVLVSSVAAVLAIPFQTWYSVSKAAILAYGHGLQGEVRPFGIEVCTLLLGDIQSGFTAARNKQAVGDDVYEGRISRSVARMERDEQNGMRAEKAADKIVRHVTKKHLAPTHTVGVQYKFFCLLQRILPTALVRRIVEMLYAK